MDAVDLQHTSCPAKMENTWGFWEPPPMGRAQHGVRGTAQHRGHSARGHQAVKGRSAPPGLMCAIWGHRPGASNNRNSFSHVLEARRLKLTCLQGHTPSRGSRGRSHLPLPAPGGSGCPWAVAASLHLCLPPHTASLTRLSSPTRETLHSGPPRASILTPSHLQTPSFQIRSHSEVVGGGEIWGHGCKLLETEPEPPYQ